MRVWLQDMKWEEAEEALKRSGNVAIIPVGATEQHGKHLPLGTDSFNAIGLAEGVAKKTGAIIVPPVWYGWSPHHMWLSGTITLRSETMVELIFDLCKSLFHHGFNKIIIINGHRWANLAPLQIAASRAEIELGVSVKLVDPGVMLEPMFEELKIVVIGHADDMETSQMLYYHPELCDMNKGVKYTPSTSKNFRTTHFPGKIPIGEEAIELKEKQGGGGPYPVNASNELGEKIHKVLVDEIVEIVEDLRKK